ncbi:glycosyltransferase involved in cell wall biosynthesis [Pedobacter sp. UYP30]|uniref:glycosyltransferase family 4 protein n=1 Tax=Pedobacter sp. UYP30 TaxID=1756400 RepID=UPI003398DF5E
MKILFIHTFYKLAGGEDTVVQNEIDLLQQNGHEVELLRFDNSPFSLAKLLTMPFNIGSYLKTKKQIRRFRPDVIHIHNMHFAGSPSIIYAADATEIPIVITLHNFRFLCPSGSLYFEGKIFLDSLKPGFPWLAVKKGVYKNSKILTFWLAFSNYMHQKLKTLNKVDTFIVLGDHSYKLFSESHLKSYVEKIVVKANFSPERLASIPSEKSYFLFIGRLTEEKGIKTLLKAVSGTDIPLKIVGSGPLENLVASVCAGNSNIEFLKQQPSYRIDELLNSAEALVFPSEWYETFGMVLTEAFSKSIPVVASNLGNISTIVKNEINGLTFEPGNYEDLRAKLLYFKHLSSQTKAKFKYEAQASYLEKYTPAVNYLQLIKIYADAISKRSYRR